MTASAEDCRSSDLPPGQLTAALVTLAPLAESPDPPRTSHLPGLNLNVI